MEQIARKVSNSENEEQETTGEILQVAVRGDEQETEEERQEEPDRQEWA